MRALGGAVVWLRHIVGNLHFTKCQDHWHSRDCVCRAHSRTKNALSIKFFIYNNLVLRGAGLAHLGLSACSPTACRRYRAPGLRCHRQSFVAGRRSHTWRRSSCTFNRVTRVQVLAPIGMLRSEGAPGVLQCVFCRPPMAVCDAASVPSPQAWYVQGAIENFTHAVRLWHRALCGQQCNGSTGVAPIAAILWRSPADDQIRHHKTLLELLKNVNVFNTAPWVEGLVS